MAKKQTTQAPAATPDGAAAAATPAGPVTLRYVGPADAESVRYGALVPGRCYEEHDPTFATYLVNTHPAHWARA